MKFIHSYWGLIIILFFSYFAIKPLFISGVFPIHDDTQVVRVYEMAKALQDGMFPVRWVADLGYGYGYPIFNFYAPLAYYFGAVLHLASIDVLIATKIMMGFGFVIAGITMYFLAKEFWGEVGATIAGLLYVYAPYHAVNLYVRGAVGELWAYGFIPLIFLSLYKIFTIAPANHRGIADSNLNLKDQNFLWGWTMIGALCLAAVILSHNLTAMMVAPFIVFILISYCLITYIKYHNSNITYYLIFTIFLGLVLSAFYWLPALTEMRYTNVASQIGGKADYRLHFVCINQLWDSPWGFGGSAPGCVDGLSFRLGKIHILFVALAVIVLPFLRKERKPFWVISVGIIFFLVSIFFTLQASTLIWDSISSMAFFQYPWRFLGIAAGASSFLGGATIYYLLGYFKQSTNISRLFNFIILSGVIGAVLFLYAKLFVPQTINAKTTKDYINDYTIKWTTSKISDEYLPKNIKKPEVPADIVTNKIDIVEGNPHIQITSEKTQEMSATVDASEETVLLIKQAFFPAWAILNNGQNLPYIVRENGLLISIPEGKNSLKIQFMQTPIELFSNILTLAGITVLFVGIIRKGFIVSLLKREKR